MVFTCNSCPVAEDYDDRIIAFAKTYAGDSAKVAVVAINVNTIPDDRLPKMKERAEKKGFPFAYLYDPTQKIAKVIRGQVHAGILRPGQGPHGHLHGCDGRQGAAGRRDHIVP